MQLSMPKSLNIDQNPFQLTKGLIGQLHFVGLGNNMIDFIHAANYLQYPIRRLINIP